MLNKLHSGNTVECIHPGMEFRVQETFVLFKSGLCGIFFSSIYCLGYGARNPPMVYFLKWEVYMYM